MASVSGIVASVKSSIVDVTVAGTKELPSMKNRNSIGGVIGNVQAFSEGLKVDKCYQFGSSAMGAIAGAVTGECTTNILDTIGNLLKNNSMVQYMQTAISKVNNAIDSVKSFGRDVVGSITNSKLGLSIRSFYCGILAPSMQILLMAIKSIIAIPLTILNALYKTIQKIKDIANALTTKLFDCFNGFLQGMQDSVGSMNVNFEFKLNDLFSFLDDVENFLKNCEIISRPLIDSFNMMISKCSPGSMRTIFNELGMTSDGVDEPELCSAADLIAFIERRKKIKLIDLSKINDLLNAFNPFDGIFKGAKALNELARTYTQYGVATLYENVMTPLHKLESRYNNLLSTRSRFLGKLVNSTIGWLFPDCGSSKFEDGIIRRSKYSILDVVNILDSMYGCNSYICGNINNQVSELLAQLEISKFGKWINPLVNANDNLNKFIDNMFAETFGTDAEIAESHIKNFNVDPAFVKSQLPLSLDLKAVY